MYPSSPQQSLSVKEHYKMSATTGPYPPQLAERYNFTIGESFNESLPVYAYDGTPHACSQGGTFTQGARAPRFVVERQAQMPHPAQANVMIGNLWQDKGNRFVDQTTQRMRKNWIELQSVWALIKKAYDKAYTPAYTRVLSGQVGTGIHSQTSWNAMTPEQRAMIAERAAEEEGKRAVNTWISQAESQLELDPRQGPLESIADAWVKWKINYQLDREHVYLKEHASQHFNESDVVRTAAMYLVHPVVVALNSDPDMYGTIGLQSENVHNQVRSDITFYRTVEKSSRAIAVLEFKRRGVIKPAELNNAIIQGANVDNITQQQPGQPNGTTRMQYALNKARSCTNNSLFNNTDMYRLVRQASAYAVTFQTRHIALCDWNYLVLCHFVAMPMATATTPTANVGDYVEVQLIPVGTTSGRGLAFQNSIGSEQFRPALLGFLKDAYDYDTTR